MRKPFFKISIPKIFTIKSALDKKQIYYYILQCYLCIWGWGNMVVYEILHTGYRLKCCWLELRLFLQVPTDFLSISSSLKPLFPCFEQFYVCKKYCKDKPEICNLSIFKPKTPDLLFKTFDKHQLILWKSFVLGIFCSPWCTCFGSTYTKIGTIQRRLAWPLRKDDTQNREAFHIFCPRDVILVG